MIIINVTGQARKLVVVLQAVSSNTSRSSFLIAKKNLSFCSGHVRVLTTLAQKGTTQEYSYGPLLGSGSGQQ